MHREDPDGQPRFMMLQTIRDYAHELLSKEPARLAELREAHADHFLEVVETFMASDVPADRYTVQRDYANVRAALAFWLADGAAPDPERSIKALRLAARMGHHWYQHGLSAEGASWLELAVARAIDPPDDLKARALRMLGVMCEVGQQFDRARDLLTHALALYEELGDRTGEARSLNSLGVVERSSGHLDKAEALFRQALEVRQTLAEEHGVSTSLSNLGVVKLDRGAWEEAADLFTQALRLDQEIEDDWGVAACSLNLGVARLVGGDVAEARRLLLEAFRLFVEVEDADGLLETMESSVGLMTALREWTVAARVAGACEASRRALHLPGSPADRAHLDRWLVTVRDALGEEAFTTAWREGGSMTHDQTTTYVREALGLAGERAEAPLQGRPASG
jgi:tetratricopeptide (TPR) repeat protein